MSRCGDDARELHALEVLSMLSIVLKYWQGLSWTRSKDYSEPLFRAPLLTLEI